MQETIVSDTSCLILMQKIGYLHLLKELFGSILITSDVAAEFSGDLPPYFRIQDPSDPNYHKILITFLDKGEASAIALALELGNTLLIIDEAKGRKEAKALGLKITGTIGILLLAKEKNLIKSLKPVFRKMDKTNFRISKHLILKALEIAKES